MARRVDRRDTDCSSFYLGEVCSWPLPGKRRGGLSIWRPKFADYSPLVDLLCRANPSFWRRIYNTQVYANTYGTRVEPQEHAVKAVTMEKVVSN
jgi:hypothetical protein